MITKLGAFHRPPGIGALLKLHPPPHLANDLQQRPPGGSLAPAAGIPSANASVAPRASGNFNPGSSNLPQPSTLPQLPGGNQLRGNFGSSSSSPSFQQYQLPQLSLSTDTMTQVSVRWNLPIYSRVSVYVCLYKWNMSIFTGKFYFQGKCNEFYKQSLDERSNRSFLLNIYN